MIFGGNRPPSGYLKTVELYNWQTGEQCQLKDLPYEVAGQAATVIDDVPVFCGGVSLTYENRCFKLNKTDQSWIQVGSIMLFIFKIIQNQTGSGKEILFISFSFIIGVLSCAILLCWTKISPFRKSVPKIASSQKGLEI